MRAPHRFRISHPFRVAVSRPLTAPWEEEEEEEEKEEEGLVQLLEEAVDSSG